MKASRDIDWASVAAMRPGERRDVLRRQLGLAETFRRKAKSRIAELGLTQAEVAHRLAIAAAHIGASEAMAVSEGKVRNVLSGASDPKIQEIRAWGIALLSSEEYLLGFSDDADDFDPADTPASLLGATATPGLLNQQIRRLTLVPNTGTSLPQTERRLSAVPDR